MDAKVDDYIRKQKSPQKEIVIGIRKVILKHFPKIKEEMKWGVPVYGNGKYYIAALKDHVNVGFSIAGLAKKDLEKFEGQGKTMQHIKILSVKDIDEKKLIGLMKLVKEECKSC